MGLSNSIDENFVFGFGNKIREKMGVDPYEPYDQSYYNGVYTTGEVYSTVANVYMLVNGASALKNAKNIFKGGISVAKVTNGGKALAGGYSIAIDGSAAIQATKGTLQYGYGANVMFAKSIKGGSKNYRDIENILRDAGFEPVRQKGSHVTFKNADGTSVTVPNHGGKDLGKGLVDKILKEAGII